MARKNNLTYQLILIADAVQHFIIDISNIINCDISDKEMIGTVLRQF